VTRRRLDALLVERGLAPSREAAQRSVMAGRVRVNDQGAHKPSQLCAPDARVQVIASPRYVSRGGEKLQGALEAFGVSPAGCVCLDVGASTGGFTDCLLQHGAERVYAIDVGRGQLHAALHADPRVVSREKVNARGLRRADFPEPIRFATIDVSFISLTLVLPAVTHVLQPCATLLSLVKPQFEAGRSEVGRGGVVRDESVRQAVLARVREAGLALGLEWLGVCASPLLGPAGNVEYFAHWRRP
jgi:23S rRNA (cytidine1920-2'-O)/16S rRNA (cytidine1409-2'-O)-methyltransferase